MIGMDLLLLEYRSSHRFIDYCAADVYIECMQELVIL